jgi:hypothetical protein
MNGQPRRFLRFSVALFVLLLSVTVLMVQSQGDPDALRPGEQITGIVEFEGARVYVGPDFAYPVIGELAQNTAVAVLGRRGDFFYAWTGEQWLEIVWGTETAWVYARLIRTSVPFNNIPPTGRPLPRNLDGRVPAALDLNDNVCDSWTGDFTRTGDFMRGDLEINVTYPELPGARVYSVITISPTGQRRAHDSLTTSATIRLDDLPVEGGTYVWRVAPYYTISDERRQWQQICLLQTGGTFDVPGPAITPHPTRSFRTFSYIGPTFTPGPSTTPIPFVP